MNEMSKEGDRCFRVAVIANLFSVFLALFIVAVNSYSQECLVRPSRFTMETPSSGFVRAENDMQYSEGNCEPVSDSSWTKWASKEFDFFVHADGPGGSGRWKRRETV